MIDNKVFNQKISEIESLKGSNASKTIINIKKFNVYNLDFCNFFDDFCFGIGLGFENIAVYAEKTDKLLGYIPRLKFYPENIFQETETYIDLTNSVLDIKSSSKLLAKETLYKIMRGENFENYIKEKYNI